MKIFKKNSRVMPNGRQGFTLIELLVVIAIIGILSSVVLASLNSARKKSRDARRVADISQIKTALELEFDKSSPSAYPTALATLKTDGFMAQIPVDPLNTGTYVYTYCPISATDYHLSAVLEENNASGPLAIDADSGVQTCTNSVTDVAGTDPTYDVRP